MITAGAHIMVCGNSKWMPKEIESAFKEVMTEYFSDSSKGN